jgi:hypothetical protein
MKRNIKHSQRLKQYMEYINNSPEFADKETEQLIKKIKHTIDTMEYCEDVIDVYQDVVDNIDDFEHIMLGETLSSKAKKTWRRVLYNGAAVLLFTYLGLFVFSNLIFICGCIWLSIYNLLSFLFNMRYYHTIYYKMKRNYEISK